ncbi:tyrosine-type recombinase/integrase [Clostridium perfringens]|uniref:tyrosine-type recombinase/integrase n=1 Tax=Clostridium perfringens TaxID=1502 RepID=UPI0018AB280F|nr:tyrosine-type recombinase/integrase [Clostridium perfringens]EJT6499999.1 tyrosine-type recombinase/integrase [Clostridium perfringens]
MAGAETIKYLEKEELDKLFKIIKKVNAKYWLRDLLLFRIGYWTGCRVSEVLLMTVDRFNQGNNQLYCQRLKGGISNTLILDDVTSKLLKKHIKENDLDGDDYIFFSQQGGALDRRTVNNLTKRYFTAAKIKDQTKHHFHTMRHTRAVLMLEDGFGIEKVKYILGHKSISNTAIYAQLTASTEKDMFNTMLKNARKNGF